jgi:hypothetical protein
MMLGFGRMICWKRRMKNTALNPTYTWPLRHVGWVEGAAPPFLDNLFASPKPNTVCSLGTPERNHDVGFRANDLLEKTHEKYRPQPNQLLTQTAPSM